jgi:hypothetical protein
MAVLIKRSSVAGKVPATTDLNYGELALNSHDGRLFLKANNGSGDAIIEVTSVTSLLNKTVTANVTLTALEYSNAMIVFSGALTANTVVTVPNTPHSFIVVNKTTGNYSLTLQSQGQTPSVVVTQGTAESLLCDTTGVYATAATTGVEFAKVIPVTANVTADITYAGALLLVTTAGVTITMPKANTYQAGTGFGILNVSGGSVTVAVQSGDSGVLTFPLTVQNNDSYYLASDNSTKWHCVWYSNPQSPTFGALTASSLTSTGNLSVTGTSTFTGAATFNNTNTNLGAVGATLNIGSLASAGTSSILFRSSGLNSTYDSEIYGTGGTASPGNGQINYTAGSHVFRIGSTAKLSITSSGVTLLNTTTDSGSGAVLQVNGDIETQWGLIRSTTYSAPSSIVLRQSDGVPGSATATQNGDQVSTVVSYAYDGAAFRNMASVDVYAEANVTNTSAPGNIRFYTTPSGSINKSERMRITARGGILIGTTTDDGASAMIVTGTATFNNTIVAGSNITSNAGKVTGNSSNGALTASNGGGAGQTSMILNRAGAPTDQKQWEVMQDGSGTFVLRTVNDAYSASQYAMQVTRASSYTLGYMSLMSQGGHVLIGGTTDNGTDELQVTGTIQTSGGIVFPDGTKQTTANGVTAPTSQVYTPAANATSFQPTGGYTVPFVQVFKNNGRLIPNVDFTAPDGVNINLTVAATGRDRYEVLTSVIYSPSTVFAPTSTVYNLSVGATTINTSNLNTIMWVYQNNDRLIPTQDFTYNTSTGVITLTNAVTSATDNYEVIAFQPFAINGMLPFVQSGSYSLASGQIPVYNGSTWTNKPLALSTGTNVTLDPSNKSASVTLSNTNSTATFGSGQSMVIGNTGVNSGKYYFEVTFTSGTNSGNAAVGLVPKTETLTAQIGYNDPSANYSVGCFQNSGNIYKNGGTSAGSASAFNTAGNVVQVAYDAGNRLVWFAVNGGNWNGSAANSPATGVGGIAVGGTAAMFPAIGTDSASVWTSNFNTAFAYSIPSGFSAWYNASPANNVTPTDVAVQFPTSGQLLAYNGTQWANRVLTPSDLNTALGSSAIASNGNGYLQLNNGLYMPDGYIQVVTPQGRNRVTNGGMLVAQRGTGTYTNGVSGYSGCDMMNANNSAGGTFTQAQGTITYGGIARKAVVQTVTATGSSFSTAGNLWLGVQTRFEGQQVFDMIGGYATLSFLFNTNVTGTYSVQLFDNTGNNSYVATFSATANTPQRVVLPVLMSASLGIPNSSALGLLCTIGCVSGTTYQTSTLNAWQTGNLISANTATNWTGVVNNFIAVGELQLEPGKINTPFERLHIATVTEQCQRYYELIYFGGFLVYNQGPTSALFTVPFNTTKRSTTTFSYNIASIGTEVTIPAGSITALALDRNAVNHAQIQIQGSGGQSSGVVGRIIGSNTQYMAFSAEL